MVVADTSVWIPYFNQPDSQEKAILDALIQHDNLALVGIVVAELLQGCQSAKEAAALVETLSALPKASEVRPSICCVSLPDGSRSLSHPRDLIRHKLPSPHR